MRRGRKRRAPPCPLRNYQHTLGRASLYTVRWPPDRSVRLFDRGSQRIGRWRMPPRIAPPAPVERISDWMKKGLVCTRPYEIDTERERESPNRITSSPAGLAVTDLEENWNRLLSASSVWRSAPHCNWWPVLTFAMF